MKNYILGLYYKLLACCAKCYIKKHKPYIIGINGSVWKTSCRMIIAQTIKKFLHDHKTYTSSKNFNWELGLSLSVFQIEQFNPDVKSFVLTLKTIISKLIFGKKPYDILILEYGIDRPGEMDFLLSIAKPHIGVFTAIDSVHSEQFWDPAKIASEESKMIKNTLELAFLNEADGYAMQLREHISIDSLVYQTEWYETKADIYFQNEKFTLLDPSGTIWVEYDCSIKNRKHHIQTNVLGKINYGYIGVALTIVDVLDYKFNKKKQAQKLENQLELKLEYQLQPGRLSVLKWVEDSVIVDSTYNSSPLSVRKIIDTVHTMKNQLFPQRKVWLLLWDMRELGDLTEKEHRQLAWYVAQFADRVFLVGQNMIYHTWDELEKIGYDRANIYKFDKSTEAGEIIKRMLKEPWYEVVLVCKWSQNTIFLEEAVKKLLKNESDIRMLTRQSSRWLKKKEHYFTS